MTPTQMECSFQHLSLQCEFGLINGKVLRVKVGYIKNSCIAKRHKMLSFANFENGGTNIKIGSLHVLLNSLST